MQLKDKITIDLFDFIKSGKFDYIKPGKTKEWVINNFPDPDFLEESPEVYNHPIWQYGNIEFHFTDDKLFLIYSDYIDSLDGGPSLELIKWLFAEPEKLNLAFVMQQLNRERIDFRIEQKTHASLAAASLTVLASGVKLSFGPAEQPDERLEAFLNRNQSQDSNEFRLQAFSLAQG